MVVVVDFVAVVVVVDFVAVVVDFVAVVVVVGWRLSFSVCSVFEEIKLSVCRSDRFLLLDVSSEVCCVLFESVDDSEDSDVVDLLIRMSCVSITFRLVVTSFIAISLSCVCDPVPSSWELSPAELYFLVFESSEDILSKNACNSLNSLLHSCISIWTSS